MVEESAGEEAGYVKMVTRVTAGCQHMFKCLRVFRRTESILEIQEGSPTIYKLAACSPQNFDERLMIYTTLFKVVFYFCCHWTWTVNLIQTLLTQ